MSSDIDIFNPNDSRLSHNLIKLNSLTQARALLLVILFPVVHALVGDIRIDLDEECAEWASDSKCAGGKHMLKTCPKSHLSSEDKIVEEETEKDSKNETEKGPEEGIQRYVLEDEDEEQENVEQEDEE
jgi:hypothetical protein